MFRLVFILLLFNSCSTVWKQSVKHPFDYISIVLVIVIVFIYICVEMIKNLNRKKKWENKVNRNR